LPPLINTLSGHVLSDVGLLTVLSYQINFLLDKCVIQDMKSQKMIGLSSLCDGLYRLNIDSCSQESSISSPTSHSSNFHSSVSLNSCNYVCSNVAISFISSNSIWQFILEYLSYQRLAKVLQLYSSISVDNKATCDVCHFAKQRKLPYNSSHYIATSKFELLHFDIWGLIAQNSIHGHKYFLTIIDDFNRFLWVILLKNKSEVSS